MASAGVAAVGTLAGTVQNRNDILPWLSTPTDDALGVGVLTLAGGGHGSQDNEADAVVQLLGL